MLADGGRLAAAERVEHPGGVCLHGQFRWASEADTRELAVEAHAARVLDALRAGEPPAVRQHDGTRLL